MTPAAQARRRPIRSSHHRHRKWSIPLGRIAGIPISLHVTFFLLVALVVVVEAQPGGLGVPDGLLWLAILFLCVLVHELAHSVLARARGATVGSIVLLPIGGVSQITHMPENWADELTIAAVGPATNLLLAVLTGAAALGLQEHLLPISFVSGPLLVRVVWINLLLGAFNLVPAFPLDGGRVLRAALERRRDPVQATQIAARIGRWLGFAMVVIGVFWDFWLVLIGFFVAFAATSEERATMVHARLRGVRVGELMRRQVATLDASSPISAVRAAHAALPEVVTDEGRYVGMAEGRDLVQFEPAGTRVGDVTDFTAPSLSPEDDLGRAALDQLVESRYPRLAVVQDGTVVGMLALEDVERWLNGRVGAGR